MRTSSPLAPPEDNDLILEEQFYYLLDHVGVAIHPGCALCQRYLRIKWILLEIFKDPKK